MPGARMSVHPQRTLRVSNEKQPDENPSGCFASYSQSIANMSPPHHPSLFFALLLIHHRFVLINRHLFHFVCEIGHLVPAFTSTAYKASGVALDERRLGLSSYPLLIRRNIIVLQNYDIKILRNNNTKKGMVAEGQNIRN